MLALQHLPHSGIIRHVNHITIEIEREMKIANEPADPRTFAGRGEGYLKYRLRPLRDHISSTIDVKKRDAIVKRLVEIKSKLAPILGNPAPSSLRESQPVHRKTYPGNTMFMIGDRTANDFHTD